jgi:arylsulfatase A-like enzyme
MTGLHPVHHRLQRLGFALPEDLPTLAEALREGGWNTAAISFNPAVRTDFGFAQGFDLFQDHRGKFGTYPDIAAMVRRVDKWLDDDPSQPFFLYLQPMNVHGPYKVPARERSVLLGRPPGGQFRYFREPMRSIMRKGRLDLRDEVDPAYLQSLVDKYDTAVRYTTDQVARILAMLSNRGLFDNTLIIITADHGEELFDHGGFNHGTSMYGELLHVPLYVKMPGQRQGSRVSAPVSLLDIVPTVLDVAGLRSLHDLDGTSLVPLLEQPLAAASFDRRPRVYQCAWRNHFVGSAIARGNFKLVRIDSNYERVTDAWLLYDLESDPGEHSDLSEIRGEVVSRLRYDLERAIARYESQAGPVPEDRRALLDRDLDRLRALGYVE